MNHNFNTMNNYLIRRATKNNDDKQLNLLFTGIFCPEEVGVMAEVIFNHYPGMQKNYWYIAEDKSSSTMVSAFALIPWTWEMNGIRLKVAEMGMVGTIEEHRGKGLMKMLNQEFDQTLQEEQFDLAVIQGIPGFYHKFGYYYAVSLENHINIPLEKISERFNNSGFTFRLAEKEDIPFLMKEDEKYRAGYLLSSVRNEMHWEYLLTHSLMTDCGAEFWIMQDNVRGEVFYFKILLKGFGAGLIVSELSEDVPLSALQNILCFCRQKAQERKKPYLRFNLHNQSAAAEQIIALGAAPSKSYAWQIKIPDKIRLLSKLKPILEERISGSLFSRYTGIFRLNFYTDTIDMLWDKGRIESIKKGGEGESTHTFCVSNDLFASLVLGHHSWEEIQRYRPDVWPDMLYILPTVESLTDKTGLLTDTLFPACKSWIYQAY
jgi:hypothetical protein